MFRSFRTKLLVVGVLIALGLSAAVALAATPSSRDSGTTAREESSPAPARDAVTPTATPGRTHRARRREDRRQAEPGGHRTRTRTRHREDTTAATSRRGAAEPGDDRGDEVEPGDDRGDEAEPGDDRGGRHGRDGDDD